MSLILAVISDWADYDRLTLLSYLSAETNGKGQYRYEWKINKSEFYARLCLSNFNPWTTMITDDIVFPLRFSVREFEQRVRGKQEPLLTCPSNSTSCPMQNIVGSFMGSFMYHPPPQSLCGSLVEPEALSTLSLGKRVLHIIPHHDLFTAPRNALFTIPFSSF